MKPKKILPLLLLIAAIFGLYQLRYWLGYAADLWQRPWAYSADPGAKLLVGRWQGSFVDPAGVAKEISLEILVPVTEEERRQRASRRRRQRQNKRELDGTAIVTSRLGEERYDLFGTVDKSDMHRLRLSFSADGEARKVLPNDTLVQAPEGRWEGDRLELALKFSRQDAQGFSHSSSEGVVVGGQLVWQDSPAEAPVAVSLRRVR